MYTGSILVAALSAATMVSAHGKVLNAVGDAGGNGTALAIKGASVATYGKNAATELDTTVYGGKANQPLTDGLGKTAGGGAVKVADITSAMAQSGATMPQVSADGTGTITGTWRVVTSDGTANNADGDLFAVLDTTGTGAYASGTQLVAKTDLVGNGKGNVVQRAVERALLLAGIQKRATNVGADATYTVTVPAGTTCTGNDAASGMTNFCLMKVVNNNAAGPFGGNVPFQMAAAGAAPAAAAGAAGNTTEAAVSTGATKATKANKATREESFKA